MRRQRSAITWVLAAGFGLTVLGLAARTAPPANVASSADPQQTPPQSNAVPALPVVSTADSNGQMIAVTGMDITGSSILYLIDTERRQLAVYQATGGSENTSSIRLVGARNIDLDLQLDGYNDKSEYSYKELAAKFDQLPAGASSDE